MEMINNKVYILIWNVFFHHVRPNVMSLKFVDDIFIREKARMRLLCWLNFSDKNFWKPIIFWFIPKVVTSEQGPKWKKKYLCSN